MEESCLSHPTPTMHAAPHLLAQPLIPYHWKSHRAQPPAQGAPPSKRLSLPTFLSSAARLEERLTSWAGRGEATALLLEQTRLMILPQVQLRKPCQLICLQFRYKTMTTEKKDDLT